MRKEYELIKDFERNGKIFKKGTLVKLAKHNLEYFNDNGYIQIDEIKPKKTTKKASSKKSVAKPVVEDIKMEIENKD